MMKFLQQTITEKYTIQNKEKANIFNDFFIKQSTLEHEDDTPPDLPQLDRQLNDITLSVFLSKPYYPKLR